MWSFEGQVRFWVGRRVPPEEVDDLVQSLRERICQFRVADHWGKEERHIHADPLVEDHERDEAVWGPTPEARRWEGQSNTSLAIS